MKDFEPGMRLGRSPYEIDPQESIEEPAILRSDIALGAAREIANEQGGITSSIDDYSTARYGQNIQEGLANKDKNVEELASLVMQLNYSEAGTPYVISSSRNRIHNSSVGVLANLHEDSDEKVEFGIDLKENSSTCGLYTLSEGSLLVGVRKVIASKENSSTFMLEDKISRLIIPDGLSCMRIGKEEGLQIMPTLSTDPRWMRIKLGVSNLFNEKNTSLSPIKTQTMWLAEQMLRGNV